MTQEEIFEMARQAGFEGCAELTWEDVVCTEELVAFAKLIAEHEREKCAKLMDEMAVKDNLTNYYKAAANAIRSREQE